MFANVNLQANQKTHQNPYRQIIINEHSFIVDFS